MPFWNVARVIPVAFLAAPPGTDPNPLGAWQIATADSSFDPDGLGATTPVYEISEPTPRTNITHRLGNGAPTAAQLALLNGWGVDANGYSIPPAGLEGCLAKVYDRQLVTPGSVGAQMLSENGLTTSPN